MAPCPPLRAPMGESDNLYKSVPVLQVQASCTIVQARLFDLKWIYTETVFVRLRPLLVTAVNFIVEQSSTFRRVTAIKRTYGFCVNSSLAAKRRLPNVLLKKTNGPPRTLTHKQPIVLFCTI